MGGKKRKSNNAPVKKESKYKIPARFDCPLCDAKASIAVKVFRALGEATVHCRSCKAGVSRRWEILPLEKAVDVFFRFREELMSLDRAYLEQHGMQDLGGTRTTPAADGGAAAAGASSTDAVGGAAASPETQLGAAASTSAPARTVTSLAELERPSDLATRTAVAGKSIAQQSMKRARAGNRSDSEYDDDDDAALHHFAPQMRVDSDNDEYDAMFR